MRTSTYDKTPCIHIPNTSNDDASIGWDTIANTLKQAISAKGLKRTVVAIECYTGVHEEAVFSEIASRLKPSLAVQARQAMKPAAEIDDLVEPYLGGDDPIFGFLTRLNLSDFMDGAKLLPIQNRIAQVESGIVLVVGCGAALVAASADILVYADLARWEAQMRQRRDEISNLGIENRTLKASLQYKRSFFIDWRVCDKFKQALFNRWDFLLDTNDPSTPKMISAATMKAGLAQAVKQPFRVVPFFDPGPWGGQWMKEVCGLDPSAENYAWCFDCVPEENSLLLAVGSHRIEIPSINLVFFETIALLGEAVYGRFGREFPIRFDFLDTMGGGNLSLQVHPLTEYIREHFGMPYTQDESYYILDAEPDACVYLGCKDTMNTDDFFADLEAAQRGEKILDDERFVGRFPAKKHDHFLIPAGTLHCSGKGSMVLEISATPYIFTFKLWDWNRLGMDGKPRPINLERGRAVLRTDRNESYARNHLVNALTPLESGDGWREERTGLHSAEFIETRRHWFTGTVPHNTQGTVNVLNLVEGVEAIVESPTNAFTPFVIHYAETFIVPAAVGAYTIRPHGKALGTPCATLKAFVRT